VFEGVVGAGGGEPAVGAGRGEPAVGEGGEPAVAVGVEGRPAVGEGGGELFSLLTVTVNCKSRSPS